MLRLVLFLLAVIAVAAGLSWLADRPGQIMFNWEGYEGEISVFHAVVGLTLLTGLAVFVWSLIRSIWVGPAVLGRYFYRRRQKRGLDALSSGMIAIGAGDKSNAMRYAIQARKTLPNEPLTHLLRAQAAQLSGDKATSRRIFESMLASADTEQLGLRGLFLEAQREGETEAARQFAERALALNPQLAWSAEALFDLQCKQGDWAGALTSLASAKKHGHVDRQVADRRRAVLLTAQAQALEEHDSDKAMAYAIEAHALAPGLVPAAAIAARILASRGNTGKAAKIIQKTWLKSPHPDLAQAYAYARVGDSPRDRLDRVRQLAALTTNSVESPIAVARAAIEARDFDAARYALEPLLDGRVTQRVATLMARIEAEQHGDKGRVREWLARAANAPRDPAWIADGVVCESWAPVSPVTGQLDAFEWKVPVETLSTAEGELIAQQIERYATLGAPAEAIGAAAAAEKAKDVTATAAEVTPVTPPQAVKQAEKQDVTQHDAKPDAKPGAVPAEVAAPRTAKPAASSATATTAPAAPAAPAATRSATPAREPETAPSAAPAASTAPAIVLKPAPSPAPAIAAPASAKPAPTPQPVPASVPAVVTAAPAVALPLPAPDSGRSAKPAAPVRKDAVAAEKPTNAEPVASAALKKPDAKPALEPTIFISPRAPDDPGPDTGDVETAPAKRPRYGSQL